MKKKFGKPLEPLQWLFELAFTTNIKEKKREYDRKNVQKLFLYGLNYLNILPRQSCIKISSHKNI